jgi:hypothetical protein
MATVALAGAAEEKPAAAAPAGTTTAAAPKPTEKVTEAVTTRLPKYEPAAAKEKPAPLSGPTIKPASAELPDDVLVLPNMQITKEQSLRGKEKDLRNPKDQLDQALKANPGLKFGPFSKLNNGIALEMQRESREAAARARLTEHVKNLPATDEERAKEEVRLMLEATARPNNDWQTRR